MRITYNGVDLPYHNTLQASSVPVPSPEGGGDFLHIEHTFAYEGTLTPDVPGLVRTCLAFPPRDRFLRQHNPRRPRPTTRRPPPARRYSSAPFHHCCGPGRGRGEQPRAIQP